MNTVRFSGDCLTADPGRTTGIRALGVVDHSGLRCGLALPYRHPGMGTSGANRSTCPQSRTLGQICKKRLVNDSLTKLHLLPPCRRPHLRGFRALPRQQAVRTTYDLAPNDAKEWFDATIVAAKASPVAEVRRLGRTLKCWESLHPRPGTRPAHRAALRFQRWRRCLVASL